MGKKLGKLLKVDAITSAAIRGRFARVCVQINIPNPLPKHVKIGSFWQDIVYENLPMLCYNCGRIGHRETHCTESLSCQTTVLPHETETHTPSTQLNEPACVSTPWKMVQTCHRTRGRPNEHMQRSKTNLTKTYPAILQRGQAPTGHALRQCTHVLEAVKRLELNDAQKPPGFNRSEVASRGKNEQPMQPRERQQ